MTTKNISASVKARLLKQAREIGRPFDELLQYYGLERFPYRLSQSEYRDRFILKGALVLRVWEAPMSRPTRDIDLLGRVDNSIENLEIIVRQICGAAVEDDGIVYDPSMVKGERIKEDADYEGVRIKFKGFLERTRIPMQIDVGFGDVVHPAAAEQDYPAILGPALATAMGKTFTNRQTAIVTDPIGLSDEFVNDPATEAQYRAFVRKAALDVTPEYFKEIVAVLREFLLPPALALSSDKRFKKQWPAAGPWH